MAAWKTSRHDEICAYLYRKGQETGLKAGWNIEREVPFLQSGKIPGDIQIRERVEVGDVDRGDFYVEVGGAASQLALQAGMNNIRETAYDVTVTASQHISNGLFGYSIAAGGPGTEARKAANKKIKDYNIMVRTATPEALIPEHGRSLRFQPLAFESSGFTAPAVRALIQKWEVCANQRLGPGRDGSRHERDGHKVLSRSSTRLALSSVIHYWNSVCLVLRGADSLRVRKSLSLMGEGQ